MKNIIKTLMLSLLVVTMSCENEDKTTVTSATAPELINPTNDNAWVLNIENAANLATTVIWNHAEYGVQTAVNYKIEFAAAGTDFAAIIDGGSPFDNQKFKSYTVAELNTIAISSGIEPFTEGELDIRIKSWLGENQEMVEYSNVVTIRVTPYVAIAPPAPELFFVGAPQAYYGVGAWDNATAIPMRYIGNGTTKVFEAYVKVNPGDAFKFIGEQGTWDNGNYGTIGGVQDGHLENGAGSQDIKIADTDGAGFYYVQVDIDQLTYKAVKMNWGIIGNATAGAWDNETAMTYDFDNNKFTISAALTAGEMKFRSKNASQTIYSEDWKFNVADTDPRTAYDTNGPNFQIAAGSYTLEVQIGLDGIATVTGL